MLFICGGKIMSFVTTAELAEKWNVSQRRVAIYCKEGRIEGAVLKGRTWIMPENTKKPEDPRRVQKIG
jgi:DNA adenine methylase